MVRGLSHLSHICNPHRGKPRIRLGAPALMAAIFCATLGSCSGGFQSVYNTGLWAQPGKYDYIKCPDIAARLRNAIAQQKSIEKYMERADQEAAGPFINVTVYSAQLEQAR